MTSQRLEMRVDLEHGCRHVKTNRPTKSKTERQRLIRYGLTLLRAIGASVFESRSVPSGPGVDDWNGEFWSITELAHNAQPGETFSLFGHSITGKFGKERETSLEGSIEITF